MPVHQGQFHARREIIMDADPHKKIMITNTMVHTE